MRASLAAIPPKGLENCTDRLVIGPASVPHPASKMVAAAVTQVFMAWPVSMQVKLKARPTQVCWARRLVRVNEGWRRKRSSRSNGPSRHRR